MCEYWPGSWPCTGEQRSSVSLELIRVMCEYWPGSWPCTGETGCSVKPVLNWANVSSPT